MFFIIKKKKARESTSAIKRKDVILPAVALIEKNKLKAGCVRGQNGIFGDWHGRAIARSWSDDEEVAFR